MKFSSKCLLFAVAVAGVNQQADAFAPVRQASRIPGQLEVTTLDEWQVLDNGSVVGSVRDHPTLTDGDIITTSPLADPQSVRSAGTVTTFTGSQYKLGNPMQLKINGGSSSVPDGPGLDRGTLIKGTGLAALFAGGLAAGYGLSGGLAPKMTIPQVSIFFCTKFDLSFHVPAFSNLVHLYCSQFRLRSPWLSRKPCPTLTSSKKCLRASSRLDMAPTLSSPLRFAVMRSIDLWKRPWLRLTMNPLLWGDLQVSRSVV